MSSPAAPKDPASDDLRRLARQVAADLDIPLKQVNLLRLAHWLATRSEACAKMMAQ